VQILETNSVESVPPRGFQEEYDFDPMPAETIPPIASNSMVHLYAQPSHASPDSHRLYRRIPKKLRVKLLSPSGSEYEQVVGWGILIIEGFHWEAFFLYSLSAFLACLLCGVVYAVLRDDIQGGFAIAGFMLAFSTFCGGLLHTKANA
jgi:hypothetical protein